MNNNNYFTTNVETKTINLGCFIVPNAGCRYDQYIINEDHKYDILNMPVKKSDVMIPVWLHQDDAADNVTDHGYTREMCDILGITDYYEQFAPSAIPYDIIKNVKEGDILTFKKNDVTVNIKFEQLPYRYGRFGKFEDVCRMIYDKSLANIEWIEEMRNEQKDCS